MHQNITPNTTFTQNIKLNKCQIVRKLFETNVNFEIKTGTLERQGEKELNGVRTGQNITILTKQLKK